MKCYPSEQTWMADPNAYEAGMVKRIASSAVGPVAVICIGLWVAGAAACQSVGAGFVGPALAGRSLVGRSLVSPTFVSSSLVSRSGVEGSLPDSPSVEAAAWQKFEVRRTDGVRPTERVWGENLGKARESKTIFDRYLSRSTGRAQLVDPNGSGTLMGRATHAAVGVFVTRDESGKGRINTSYFLRALTAVAADTASRPYWRRSPGEPLADFGSTVGNDAGMNLLHEFGPGLQQMMKSHAPRFVTRMVEKVARN